MRARVIALLVGLLALPALAEAEGPASARASVLGDRIDLGTVSHPEHGVQWGRAEAVVDARPDDVLAVLHDYSQYAGLFPYFQKSKVLSQRGSDAIVYLEAKVLHGAATLWSQVRMRGNQNGEVTVVEARMMKGKGNIDQLLARWEISPVNGGEKSLVVFQLLVDPDLPVPDGIVSDEMRKGAGKAMRALRERVYQRVSYASRRPSAT